MQKEIQPKPILQFPDFNKAWSKVKFSNIVNIKMGQSPKSETYNSQGIGLPLIQGNADVKKGFTDPRQSTSRPTKICEVDDIILAVRAPVGLVAKSKHKACIGRGVCSIKAKSKYNTEFVYQFLLGFQDKWKRIEQGSTFLAISGNDIRNIKLHIPPFPEQEKIADFLSSIDTHIQTLEKKKEALELYKKGVTQKIFKQEIRFKDDDGSEFPEWEKCKLSKLCDRVTQKNKIDNQNVLTISAQMGLVNQLEYFNRSVSSKNLKGYHLLQKNDFAYNKSYSNGYPMGAIKRLKYYEKGVVSTLYICFRFKETVSFKFMEQYFDSGLQNKEIKKVAQEGARNHGLLNIGVNDFFDIRLSLPSIEEQTKIANFLSSIDEQINGITQQIEHTKTYKKGLLQQMFV